MQVRGEPRGCPAPPLIPRGPLWPLWLLPGWRLPSSLHPAEGPRLCGRCPGPAPLSPPHPLWSWTQLHRRGFLTFHLEGRGTPASPLLHEAHCTSPLPKTCSVPQGLASVPRAQTHPASLPPVRPQSPSSSQRTSCRFGHSHFCGHGVTHARKGLPRWVLFLYQRWGLTGLSLMPWGGAHARAHRESWTLRD